MQTKALKPTYVPNDKLSAYNNDLMKLCLDYNGVRINGAHSFCSELAFRLRSGVMFNNTIKLSFSILGIENIMKQKLKWHATIVKRCLYSMLLGLRLEG